MDVSNVSNVSFCAHNLRVLKTTTQPCCCLSDQSCDTAVWLNLKEKRLKNWSIVLKKEMFPVRNFQGEDLVCSLQGMVPPPPDILSSAQAHRKKNIGCRRPPGFAKLGATAPSHYSFAHSHLILSCSLFPRAVFIYLWIQQDTVYNCWEV